MGRWIVALLGVLSLLGPPALAQEEVPGDPPVGWVSENPATDAIGTAMSDRTFGGGTFRAEAGFVTMADIDGDEVNDALLDWGALSCDGLPRSCGTGGCTHEIWLGQTQGPYRRLLSDLIVWIERPAPGRLRIAYDGGACGLSGAEICLQDYEIRDGALREVP